MINVRTRDDLEDSGMSCLLLMTGSVLTVAPFILFTSKPLYYARL